MGQGNDRGTQYRSALYYFDEEQKQLYEASCAAYEKALKEKGKGRGKITTEIRAAKDFPEAGIYGNKNGGKQWLSSPNNSTVQMMHGPVLHLYPFLRSFIMEKTITSSTWPSQARI